MYNRLSNSSRIVLIVILLGMVVNTGSAGSILFSSTAGEVYLFENVYDSSVNVNITIPDVDVIKLENQSKFILYALESMSNILIESDEGSFAPYEFTEMETDNLNMAIIIGPLTKSTVVTNEVNASIEFYSEKYVVITALSNSSITLSDNELRIYTTVVEETTTTIQQIIPTSSSTTENTTTPIIIGDTSSPDDVTFVLGITLIGGILGVTVIRKKVV